VLAAPPSATRGSAAPASRDTLYLAPYESVVCLNHPFVFPSTLRIREGDRLLVEGSDYVLNGDSGCLTVIRADTTRAPRTLVASYRSLSEVLAGSYRLEEDPHHRRSGTASVPVKQAEPVELFTGFHESAGLELSGSKTFGIEIGNRRDLKLRQSLDIRLTGEVAPDVRLLAILSDQDIPFQPQGNTAELEELDKVLVELRAPAGAVGLGDVEVHNRGTRFLNLDRRLEGLSAEGVHGGVRVRTLLA